MKKLLEWLCFLLISGSFFTMFIIMCFVDYSNDWTCYIKPMVITIVIFGAGAILSNFLEGER